METTAQRKTRIARIIAALRRAHPDAKLALDFDNPIELLVDLILAAQFRDDRVNEITPPLFKKYRTAADWAAAPLASLQSELRGVFGGRMKAKRIKDACRMLVDEYDGEAPRKLEDLLELPGVGRKTANILLGNAFGVPGIGVDRHVARVSTRLGLTAQSDPDKIEADLTAIVAEQDQIKFCHLMQFHGRRICVARQPKCPECPISSLCAYPDKTPSAAPGKPVKRG
jgi:endonuclease-3